jgi:hypothetical protein
MLVILPARQMRNWIGRTLSKGPNCSEHICMRLPPLPQQLELPASHRMSRDVKKNIVYFLCPKSEFQCCVILQFATCMKGCHVASHSNRYARRVSVIQSTLMTQNQCVTYRVCVRSRRFIDRGRLFRRHRSFRTPPLKAFGHSPTIRAPQIFGRTSRISYNVDRW